MQSTRLVAGNTSASSFANSFALRGFVVAVQRGGQSSQQGQVQRLTVVHKCRIDANVHSLVQLIGGKNQPRRPSPNERDHSHQAATHPTS